MNREIKFRVWDKQLKQMLPVEQWANKSWVAVPVQVGEQEWELNQIPIENVHIMQYTGLKDKNGKEIYEGDILESKVERSKGSRVRIQWSDKAYGDAVGFGAVAAYGDTEKNIHHFAAYGEVIGNIYENPNLLSV